MSELLTTSYESRPMTLTIVLGFLYLLLLRMSVHGV